MYNKVFVVIFSTWIMSILAIVHSVPAQSKLEKRLSRVEQAYVNGKLKRANKSNKKILRESASLQNPEVKIKAHLYQGLILVGMGRHFEYENSILEAVSLAKSTYKDTGRVVSEIYLGAAEAYYNYGNYRKAALALNSSKAAWSNSSAKDLFLLENWQIVAARVNTKLGFLAKADSLVRIVLPKVRSRLDTKGKEVDPSAAAHPLYKKSIEASKIMYAGALSAQADIAYEKGLYKRADSLYKSSNRWIARNIGKRNPIYASNVLHQGFMQEEDGSLKKASKLYDEAYMSVNSRQDLYYFANFNQMIYGRMVKDEFLSTPRKALTQLDRRTRIYNKKENVFYGNKEVLEEWFTAKKICFQ